MSSSLLDIYGPTFALKLNQLQFQIQQILVCDEQKCLVLGFRALKVSCFLALPLPRRGYVWEKDASFQSWVSFSQAWMSMVEEEAKGEGSDFLPLSALGLRDQSVLQSNELCVRGCWILCYFLYRSAYYVG